MSTDANNQPGDSAQAALVALNELLIRAECEARTLERSKSWRLGRLLVGLWNGLWRRPIHAATGFDTLAVLFAQRHEWAQRLGLATIEGASHEPPTDAHDYSEWVRRYDMLTPYQLDAMRQRVAHFGYRPLVSIIMPVDNTADANAVEAAIESVARQTYPQWELCIAGATADATLRSQVEQVQRNNERIRLAAWHDEPTGDAAELANAALAIARGEFVALLEPHHHGVLREHALFVVVEELQHNHERDCLYTDEDRLTSDGTRVMPRFKPRLIAEWMRSRDVLGNLAIYRRSLLEKLGGWRPGFADAYPYDLALRMLDEVPPERIRHIPVIAYHSRTPTTPAMPSPDAAKRAVVAHLERRGETGVTVKAAGRQLQLRYPLPQPPPAVSLIVPTRDRLDLLRPCLESLLTLTDYPAFEIVVVDNASRKRATATYLTALQARDKRVKTVRHDAPFNFAQLNRVGIEASNGTVLGLINNDIEATAEHAGWLREMVSHAVRPDVGAVGAKLHYPNGRIQHAGIVLGSAADVLHLHRDSPRNVPGFMGRAQTVQEFRAVTGSCLVMRRSVYDEVGGLDPTFAVSYNDIDLCLRLRAKGYRIIWTPYATLIHRESASRGPDVGAPDKQARHLRERIAFACRWYAELADDPAYNPNLSVEREDVLLAWPPRRKLPQLPV